MEKNKKNVKNDKKNLEDPKKSVTFAAEKVFYTPFTAPVIFEKSSSVPTKNLVPNEALGLRDMFLRTQRGQRLDVHTRMRTDDCPDNMYRAEYEPDPNNPGQVRMKADPHEETLDAVPPGDVNDIVDVLRHSEEIAERKKALYEKRKKDIANAKKAVPAPAPKGEEGKTVEETKKE